MTLYTCDSCGGTGVDASAAPDFVRCAVCDGYGRLFEEDTVVLVSFKDSRPVYEQRASWDKLRATLMGWRAEAGRSNVQRLMMGDQIARDRKW